LLAHTSYWKDPLTLTYIVSRTYGMEVLPITIEAREFLPLGRVRAYRAISLMVFMPLLIGAVLVLLYGAWWVLVHPVLIWKPIWGGIQKLLGI
jgi:hypothetical protein